MLINIDKEKLEKLYIDDRLSVVDIAKYFKVSRDTIYNRLKKYNLSRESKYNIDAIKQAYEQDNFNITQLLKLAKISNRTVLLNILEKNNIKNPIKENISELYLAGFSDSEIATELNIDIKEVLYNKRHHSIYRLKILNIDKDELQSLRTKNTLAEIAEKYNCSERTISAYIKKYKLPEKDKQQFYFDEAEITELYIKFNLTMDEIAEIKGCCRKTINDFIRSIGITKTNKENSLERKIREFLENLNINYIQNDRKYLEGKEIDFYLPDYKIGLEICGLYWHSTKVNKDKYHIKNKFKLAENKNIRLITIFEDEILDNFKIVKQRLIHILNKNIDKIYARNCVVQEITNTEGIRFLKNYHIQGSGKNKLYYGAYYNNDLVAVMTFSRPSIAKGSAKADWELNRFASKGNIVGIASKMFKHFIRKHPKNTIISYADLRWNTGDLYNQLGFKYSHTSNPNYWYVQKQERLHRFSCTKQKLLKKFPNSSSKLTEETIAENNGLYRIYDCGNAVYKYQP